MAGGKTDSPSAQSTPARTGSAKQGTLVLVVDDDPDIVGVIRMSLEDEGYAVMTASNGVQALDCVRNRLPSMVLLDLTMPVMNGWQCHEQLRESTPGLPVIFMTAAFRARAEAESHGAAGFLAKPFDVDDLLDTVAHFARRSGN